MARLTTPFARRAVVLVLLCTALGSCGSSDDKGAGPADPATYCTAANGYQWQLDVLSGRFGALATFTTTQQEMVAHLNEYLVDLKASGPKAIQPDVKVVASTWEEIAGVLTDDGLSDAQKATRFRELAATVDAPGKRLGRALRSDCAHAPAAFPTEPVAPQDTGGASLCGVGAEFVQTLDATEDLSREPQQVVMRMFARMRNTMKALLPLLPDGQRHHLPPVQRAWDRYEQSIQAYGYDPHAFDPKKQSFFNQSGDAQDDGKALAEYLVTTCPGAATPTPEIPTPQP